jgi:hypothetical protein
MSSVYAMRSIRYCRPAILLSSEGNSMRDLIALFVLPCRQMPPPSQSALPWMMSRDDAAITESAEVMVMGEVTSHGGRSLLWTFSIVMERRAIYDAVRREHGLGGWVAWWGCHAARSRLPLAVCLCIGIADCHSDIWPGGSRSYGSTAQTCQRIRQKRQAKSGSLTPQSARQHFQGLARASPLWKLAAFTVMASA